MANTLIRVPEVTKRLGHKCVASTYNDVRRGLITKQLPIGVRAVGWPLGEIEALAEARSVGVSADGIRAMVDSLHAKRAERKAELERGAL